MTEWNSVIDKLRYEGSLIYVMTNVACLVIDMCGGELIEIPDGHLECCLCNRLACITKENIDYKHMYDLCERAGDDGSPIIYRCPYDLTNVIIPVKREGHVVAALQVGPIMTVDAYNYIEYSLREKLSLSDETMEHLWEDFSCCRAGDLNFIVALSEMMASMNNAGRVVTSAAKQPSVNGLFETIIQFVSLNYMSDISLDDIAKYAYVSSCHVSRVFNRNMGCNFRDYLQGHRVSKAKELLRDTDLNIAQVSAFVGFSDQSYFTKIFKKIENLTPGQYRKSLQIKE